MITALTVGYLLLFLALQLAWQTPLGNWWLLRLLNIFGYWLYAPWIPLTVLALLSILMAIARQSFASAHRIQLLALAVVLLCFLLEYGAAFLPRLASRVVASEESVPVRVLSWNIYFDNGAPQALIDVIERESPDLLAIQEYGLWVDETLPAALQAEYPYQVRIPHSEPIGFALFSRYPILSESPAERGQGRCSCHEVVLDIHGRRVTLINVHPHIPETNFRTIRRIPVPTQLDTRLQDSQFEAILARIPALPQPALLLGDFNASDRMPAIRQISRLMRDSFREAGWGLGLTFPVDAHFFDIPLVPLVRLDYIFHDDGWIAQRAWIGEAKGPDHRYLVVDLLLK